MARASTVAMFSLALGLLACEAVVSNTEVGKLRAQSSHVDGVKHATEFKRRLRICNAYPSDTPMNVYIDKRVDLTRDVPLAYTSCEDYLEPLWPGDRLEFKLAKDNAGYFAIGDLPNMDATLLLVIYRHDTLSTAASFESHVFASLKDPQVVVLDAHQGKRSVKMRIMDPTDRRVETLRFGGVVAVSPGRYEVEFDGANVNQTVSADLVALPRESYVVMRTGVVSQSGPSYPEALVVYPMSSDSMFGGAQATGGKPSVLLFSLLAAIPLLAVSTWMSAA